MRRPASRCTQALRHRLLSVSGHDRACNTRLYFSATTVFFSVPISGTMISTTSPAFSHFGGSNPMPVPTGVPVEITSPGFSVVKCVM